MAVEAVAEPETEVELPGEGEEEQPEPETIIEGARGVGGQLAFDVKVPIRPDRSTVRFTGEGEFEVDGMFDVGDKIITIREATVEFGGNLGHRDRAMDEFTSATRKHTAHVDRTRQLRPDQWERVRAILDEE